MVWYAFDRKHHCNLFCSSHIVWRHCFADHLRCKGSFPRSIARLLLCLKPIDQICQGAPVLLGSTKQRELDRRDGDGKEPRWAKMSQESQEFFALQVTLQLTSRYWSFLPSLRLQRFQQMHHWLARSYAIFADLLCKTRPIGWFLADVFGLQQKGFV